MEPVSENRFGQSILQPGGYHAYIPHYLASRGPQGISLDYELMNLLSDASKAVGELNGITKLLKNPDLFIAFYVKKEALLSSQIEGTECSLEEILEFDNNSEPQSVNEVVRHVRAMNYGLEKLKQIPFSVRLIKDIHSILLSGVRGGKSSPGEFKKNQNWIGYPGKQINEATFVPVPPNETLDYMSDLEKYYHKNDQNPLLIKVAIIHTYFETIHPFNDGNGRIGRLLITFLLCDKRVLKGPLLYLSLFLKKYRSDYYSLLMDVRTKGDWNEWIKFFLRGVRETASNATNTANELFEFIEKRRKIVDGIKPALSYAHRVYDILCQNPLISIAKISSNYQIPYPTIKRTIEVFKNKGLLSLKDSPKGLMVSMDEYIDILKKDTDF